MSSPSLAKSVIFSGKKTVRKNWQCGGDKLAKLSEIKSSQTCQFLQRNVCYAIPSPIS